MLGGLWKNEKGSAAVIASIAIVVLLAVSALVVDLGIAYEEQSSFQTALDSAVLAAAAELPDTTSAAQKASEYIVKNGYSASDISVNFEQEGSVIRVSGTKRAELNFAKIFSVDHIDIEASAGAKKELWVPEMFKYLLFSGSTTATLYMGGKFQIEGSVHSNGSLSASPSYGVITGTVSSVKNLYMNPNTTTVGRIIRNAPVVEMTDFTPYVNSVIPTTFATVLTASQVNTISQKQYFYGNTKIIGNCIISNQAVIEGNLYVEGNLTINGGAPVCVLNGSIYATGAITFGNSFKGSGSVFAKGNISFQGGQAEFTRYKTICIYSELGNISLSTNSSEINGTIYAPNGKVNIQGGTTIFYGSIAGKEITGMPSDLNIRQPNLEFSFNPNKDRVRLVK